MASIYIIPAFDTPYLYQFNEDETTLTHLQSLVGGYIEHVTVPQHMLTGFNLKPHQSIQLIVDEEGLLKDKPRNTLLPEFVGTVIIALMDISFDEEKENDFFDVDERLGKQILVMLMQYFSGRRVN